MTSEIAINTVAKACGRGAPVYDIVWGAVFDAGRKASIAAAERIGGRILDVGIGTGILLEGYARSNRIVGVDYSEPMLRKAHERVLDLKLTPVDALAGVGARPLCFSARFFAAVGAPSWFSRRLLRCGGRAIRDYRGARSGGDARRVRPRHPARRRDHPGQPSRRRCRPDARGRAGLRADGTPARLATGIPLATPRPV